MSNVIDSRGDGQLCRNCHYWVPGHGGGAIGECRRYAPKPHNTGLALRRRDRSDATEGNAASWPETHRTEWCGEWEAERPPVPPDDQIRQLIRSSRLSVRARKVIARAEGEGRSLSEMSLFTLDDWVGCKQSGLTPARELRDFFAGIRSMPGGEHTEGGACTGG